MNQSSMESYAAAIAEEASAWKAVSGAFPGSRKFDPAAWERWRQAAGATEAIRSMAASMGSMMGAGPPVTREAQQPPEVAAFDASLGNSVVVGADGRILAVNRNWRQFARDNGLPGWRFLGTSYFDVCEAVVGADGSRARNAAAGIRRVLEGSQELFELIYPCHAPHEQRWFRMQVSGYRWQGCGAAVVTHLNITSEVLAALQASSTTTKLQAAEHIGEFGTFHFHLQDGRMRGFGASVGLQRLLGAEAAAGADALVNLIAPEARSELHRRMLASLHASGSFRCTLAATVRGRKRVFELDCHEVRQGPQPHQVVGMVRDVTRHAEREEALADSRAALKAAGRSLGSWIFDGRSRAVLLSPSARAILKVPAGQPLGATRALRLLVPEHRTALLQALRNARTRPDGVDLEVQARGRRRPFWIRITGSWGREAAERLRGGIQLIDGHKRTELALQEAGDALDLLAQSHEVIVRATCEAELLQAICDIALDAGKCRAAWVATPQGAQGAHRVAACAGALDGHMRHESAPGMAQLLSRSLRRRKLEYVPDLCASSAYGRWSPAHRRLGLDGFVAVRLAEGSTLLGVLVLYFDAPQALPRRQLDILARIGRDVGFAMAGLRARSERTSALDRIAEQAELLQAAMAVARLASVEMDRTDGSLHASEGVPEVLGLRRPPADLAQLLRAFDPDSAECLQAALDAKKTARATELELRLAGPGPARWVRVREARAVRAANGSRTALVFQDITAVREAREAAMRMNAELEARVEARTRQLEAANRELAAFSYSVSHDLKAPLAAIDGFTHVLGLRLSDRLDARERSYMEKVRTGVANMFGLIDAMLELSSLSSAQALNVQDVDVSSMARAILQELHEQEPARSLRAQVQEGMVMRCDAALMKIALRNLIGNAWKFSARKSETVVEVSMAPPDRGQHMLRIRDEGAGFEPKLADRIFAPFQRLHRSSDFPGTGIGLATVRRIINRHGGTVSAEGAPGQGACFTLSLPQGCVLPPTPALRHAAAAQNRE